jgi:hypothetical protein
MVAGVTSWGDAMALAMDYPNVLTNRDWQKAKGVLAKIFVGKTDVGANLTALEADFKKSDFCKEPAPFDGLDPIEFKAFIKARRTELDKQADSLATKAAAAIKVASQAAGEMKANSKVPASVSKYLSGMIVALDKFESDIKAMPDKYIQELTEAFRKKLQADAIVKTLRDSCTKVSEKWKKLPEDIKTCEANPTVATVGKVFSGDNNARGIAAAAQFWDKTLVKQFPKATAAIYTGSAIKDYYSLPFLQELAMQLGAKTIQALIEKSGESEDKIVTAVMHKFSGTVMTCRELVDHMQALLKEIEAV